MLFTKQTWFFHRTPRSTVYFYRPLNASLLDSNRYDSKMVQNDVFVNFYDQLNTRHARVCLFSFGAFLTIPKPFNYVSLYRLMGFMSFFGEKYYNIYIYFVKSNTF